MLAADGYELSVREQSAGVLLAEIKPGQQACADCVGPKTMMQGYLVAALRSAPLTDTSGN
jgi:hypothetical protein